MSHRRSQRARKVVDYSKIGEIEGLSDEELGGRLQKDDANSDSDEFQLDEKNGQNGENGEVKEIDDDDDDDLEEVPDDEDEDGSDIGKVDAKKNKSQQARYSSKTENEKSNDGEIEDKPKKISRINRLSKPTKTRPSKTPGSKAETLKERFQLFYGNNNEAYVYAIKQRIKWASTSFIPLPNLFEVPDYIERLSSGKEDYYDILSDHDHHHHNQQKLTSQPINELNSYVPGLGKIVECQTDLDDTKFVPLSCFESTYIHSSRPIKSGFILNCGSFITCAKWAPTHNNSPIQYLAVSTMNCYDNNNDPSSVNSEIAAFSTQHSPSSIQIYRINTDIESILEADNNENTVEYCRLVCVITTEYGPVTTLEWRPSQQPLSSKQPQSSPTRRHNRNNKSPKNSHLGESTSGATGHIGILAASFQDGKLRVFDVTIQENSTSPVYYKLESPLREFSLDSKINCMSWRTVNCIVVGTSDGFIAEFDISDKSPSGIYPSYYVPLHDSLINVIATCFPDNQELIFTSSTDGFTRLVDVRDILHNRTVSTRMKGFTSSASYCHQLHSFVSLEDYTTTKLVPIRRLNILLGGTSMARHNGTVTSVAASYLHPMVLSGGADGTLHIGNAIRRATVGKRQTNAVYKEAILWKFDAPEAFKDKYRFIDILKAADVSKGGAIESQIIYPRSAVVTSTDWNLSLTAGSWYAAGLSSGLLRIENLAV